MDELTVSMNGELVGTLTRRRGRLTLRYDQAWLDSPLARPLSLSLPLSVTPHSGTVVHDFFDNLLPDNADIRTRIQRRFELPTDDVFDLLGAIGRDCVGALQLTHPGDSFEPEIRTTPLADARIAEILRSYHTEPLGMAGDDDDFRISIAGAQEKTALTWIEGQWCRPHGNTPTTHILKLPIGPLGQFRPDLSDSVENEWLCLKILAAYGLSVAKADIGQFEDVKVLVVERFDRVWRNGRLLRLPHEDLCQATGQPSDNKYESDGGPGITQIMGVLLGSRNADDDRRGFVQAVMLNWLLAASDGHAKNFSIQLLPGGAFQLAPFYDVMSVYPYFRQGSANPKKQKLAMAAVGKNRHYKWSEIRAPHWLSTAAAAGVRESRARAILMDLIDRTPEVTRQVEAALPAGFPASVSEPVLSGLEEQVERATKQL